MTLGRTSPGACPICGAAHAACTAGAGPITSALAPARDAAAAPARTVLASESVRLGPGQFTTATYRGTKKKR